MSDQVEVAAPSTSKPTVCCVMPCRTIPHPRAFKALQIACARYGAPFDTPALEPRERNRNTAVSQFLETKDYDWLLMVDDDTTIPPNTIDLLLAVKQPLVTGIQPLYMPVGNNGDHTLVANVMRFPTHDTSRPHWPDYLTWKPPTAPFKVFHCGFGCVLIHRKVLEDTGFPWFSEYYGDSLGRNNITEDIYFCDHARRAGFDVWCQPAVVCGHYKTINLCDIVPKARIDWKNVGTYGGPRAYHDISGFFPASAERLFEALTKWLRPDGTWVELGVFRGKSICYVAEWLTIRGKHSARLIGIDSWHGSPELPPVSIPRMEQECRNSLARAEILHRVDLRTDDSAQAAAKFEDASVDVVYIDAAHDQESVLRDIAAWKPKVRPDGVMCGDDYSSKFPGVVAAVDLSFGDKVQSKDATWAVAMDNRTLW